LDNRTALIFALLISGAAVADFVLDWGALGFLTKKVIDLIGWMAFWR